MTKISLKNMFVKSQGLLLIGFFLLLISSCQWNEKLSKPNIIFIMSDDHAAHAISSYGGIYDKIAPTPNIDKIGSDGIRFENVFCTNGICGPSRASILTGKYSHRNGFYKNEKGGKFDKDQWTFPKEFQENGYQTALFGKWHLGSEPVGFHHFKYHDNKGQQGFYYNPIYNENGNRVTEEGYATNLTTDFALNWLKTEGENEKPFMMMLQFKAPHRSWEPDEKYRNLFGDQEMPYPITFNDNYEGREQTAGDTDMTMDFFNRKDMKLSPPDSLTGKKERNKWLRAGDKRGFGEGWLPQNGMTQQEARKWKYQRYIKDYLACIKSVDDNIGRVLDYLEKSGLDENTVVIYTSDQGFYLGDHGWFDKRFMYEESLKMPFLMRYPGIKKQKNVNRDVITNIDFASTLLDIAGIEEKEDLQGRSFLSNVLDENSKDWRQSMYYHYYEFPFWHHVQPHYGIRNEKFKLIHFYYNIDVWELYNLQNDPEEMTNLINDPTYNDVIKGMKLELYNLQMEYGDDKSLDEFRSITDANFGHIGGKGTRE